MYKPELELLFSAWPMIQLLATFGFSLLHCLHFGVKATLSIIYSWKHLTVTLFTSWS